jgi:hypothetical protein
MVMCYLVSQHIHGSIQDGVPSSYEPRIVFHFSYEAKEWIETQGCERDFDIREIECEGF